MVKKKQLALKLIPKAGHRLALGMNIQKEVISNQKQLRCKKRLRSPKKPA